MDKQLISLNQLEDHPLNRRVIKDDPAWENFFASVGAHGVLVPPVVREISPGRFQVLAGHRRKAAAELHGIEALDCLVKPLTDREALELLVIENLERANPDPVEEAKLVRALLKEGVTPEELESRIHRSVEWIQCRQGLLDLGDEVCAAVRRPKDDDYHLSMAAVEVLLATDESVRREAIQLVLHPQFQVGPLNGRQAAEVVRENLMEPLRLKREWEKSAPKMVKAWKKRLGELLDKEERKELVIQEKGWEERDSIRFRKPAEEELILDPQCSEDDEVIGKRWLHLAIRNGLPVWIIPASNEEGSEAVVDENLLRMAEAAREERGVMAWLVSKPRGASSPAPRAKDEPEAGDEAVDKALSVLNGEGEKDFDDQEKPQTVIEQRVESSAWVNLSPVRDLKAWVEDATEDSPPTSAPNWACELAVEGRWERLREICDWVLSLKDGANREAGA